MKTLYSLTALLLCLGFTVSLATAQQGLPPSENGQNNNPGIQQTLSPAVVVDSTGQLVGRLIDVDNSVVPTENSTTWFSINLEGIQKSGFSFLHTTTDCRGTRYLTKSSAVLLTQASSSDGQTVYFPDEPIVTLNMIALERIATDGDASQPGACNPNNIGDQLVGEATSLDLSHLVPPFHVE